MTNQTEINFATATKAEIEAAGFTFKKVRGGAKLRGNKKSLFGVKVTGCRKGCKRRSLANAIEAPTGLTMRG